MSLLAYPECPCYRPKHVFVDKPRELWLLLHKLSVMVQIPAWAMVYVIFEPIKDSACVGLV